MAVSAILARSGRWLALGAIAALAGCATAPTAIFSSGLPPRAEALAYIAETAPLVAVVRTDASMNALAASGLLDPLVAIGDRHGVPAAQVRSLLGHDLVVGLPFAGAAPLAVLVTRDADFLAALARARVLGGRAARAGSYRGAELYAGTPSYAIRGPVLLVSRTTADLRRALDVRAETDGFDPELLRRAVPAGDAAALVRGVGDLRALLPRLGERARAVPLVAAVQQAGFALRTRGDRVELSARIALDHGSLVERDVPISPGDRAPAGPRVATAATLSVRDLAHTLGVIERSAAAAAPLAHLRFAALRAALRRGARSDLDRDVVANLHGPATLVLAGAHSMLRASPSHPRALAAALKRIAGRSGRIVRDLRISRRGRFSTVRRHGRLLGRYGVVGGVLVAGRAGPLALAALARRPLARPARARGGLTFSVPAAALPRLPGLPRRAIAGWVRGGTGALELSASAPLR